MKLTTDLLLVSGLRMGGVMSSVLPIYAFTECKGKIYLYLVSELEAILSFPKEME
jgi:hypothetical protein